MANIYMAKRFESNSGEEWPWHGPSSHDPLEHLSLPDEVRKRLLAGAVIKDLMTGSTFKLDDDGMLVETLGTPLGGRSWQP